ncbi:hypothetical protein ACLMJK_009344 [Lecanora helva]
MVIRCPYPDISIPEESILSYLFGSGEALPDDPLWINAADTTQYISLRTALQWIKRLSIGLDRAGVKRNGVVMTVTPNHIFVPIALLGAVCSCRIFSGANPAYSVDEISYQMRNTEAQVVLVHPSLLQTARLAAKKAGLADDKLLLFSDAQHQPVDDIQDWFSILGSDEEASNYSLPHLSGPEAKKQIATLNYSSGTTGLPKGVMITHSNLVSNVSQALYLSLLREEEQNVTQERWVGMLPLYHAFGQFNSIMLAIKLQVPVYIMTSFVYEDLLNLIQTRKITELQLVPPIVVLLTKHPATAKYDLSSVIKVSSGAAPLSQSLANACASRFKTAVRQGWGMTELTCAGIFLPNGFSDETGSVGFLCPNSEVKLLDENGNEVGTGQRGEILIRGPQVSPGYWRNEKATRETMLEGGWLKTGDVAISDERGWFWIVDRLKVSKPIIIMWSNGTLTQPKELIKVSGFQVAPAELEALLLTHPAIADAGVVGIPDSFDAQERPRAYIQLKESGSTTAEEIQAWIKTRVAKHKNLTGGVKFVEAVPKSAAGKIQRRVMKGWAKKDAQAGKPKL